VIEYPEGSRTRVYTLTDKGTEEAARRQTELKPPLNEYLGAVTKFVTSLNFQDLVRTIYRKYPAYKQNSIFAD
jgi:DNA-binding PadR family transcriptional regulator